MMTRIRTVLQLNHDVHAAQNSQGNRDSRDAGATAIELVGVVFMLVVVTLLLVQGLVIAQAGAATQKAARDGARAMALGRDSNAAVRAELPDWARIQRINTSGSSVDSARIEVEVRIPIVLPGITSKSFTVTRDAEMPRAD